MIKKFYKLEGLGNDFVLFDCLKESFSLMPRQIQRICQRRFGVGADGILLVLTSTQSSADYQMRIFNADGSEAEMCGNGIRAFAHYLYFAGLEEKNRIAIQTLAGIVMVERKSFGMYKVAMGRAEFSPEKIPILRSQPMIDEKLSISGCDFQASAVSMGNPHCVIFVDDVDNIPLSQLGPEIEHHKLFPNRTNVEFVQVISPDYLKVRVWERGAGETLACGTGACAVVAVACRLNKARSPAKVLLPGGELEIEYIGDECFLTGPARLVYKGEVELENFN